MDDVESYFTVGELAPHLLTFGQCYSLPCSLRLPNAQAIKAEAGDGRDTAGTGAAPKENGESAAVAREGDPATKSAGATDAMDDEEDEEDEEAGAAMMPIKGPLPPQEGSWASCVRLLDPIEGATVECLELSEYHVAAVLSKSVCFFSLTPPTRQVLTAFYVVDDFVVRLGPLGL